MCKNTSVHGRDVVAALESAIYSQDTQTRQKCQKAYFHSIAFAVERWLKLYFHLTMEYSGNKINPFHKEDQIVQLLPLSSPQKTEESQDKMTLFQSVYLDKNQVPAILKLIKRASAESLDVAQISLRTDTIKMYVSPYNCQRKSFHFPQFLGFYCSLLSIHYGLRQWYSKSSVLDHTFYFMKKLNAM